MLTIEVHGGEQWDQLTETFINTESGVLKMEHSLVSISKWEAKWKKPFLSKDAKTRDEELSYIQCMILDDTDPLLVNYLTPAQLKEISDYIGDPMTATTVKSDGKKSREIITSEVVYYWMVASTIPFECQYWHFNRLMKLIEVTNLKNNPKKMGKKDIMRNNASLNAARRKASHSKG